MSGNHGFSSTFPVEVSERPRPAWTIRHLGRGFSSTLRHQHIFRAWNMRQFAVWNLCHTLIRFHSYPLCFRSYSNLFNRLYTFPQASCPIRRGLSDTMRTVRAYRHGLSDTFTVDYRAPFSGVSITFPWTIGHLDLEEPVMRVRLAQYAYMLYSHSFLIVPVLRSKEPADTKYWKYETPIQNHKLISQSPLAHVAGWNVTHHAHSPAGLRNARFEHRKGQTGVGDG